MPLPLLGPGQHLFYDHWVCHPRRIRPGQRQTVLDRVKPGDRELVPTAGSGLPGVGQPVSQKAVGQAL
ncbi:MAG TPA: hypothetical protein P5280_10155, partial [Cyclobacteriaceae bacterium]|nr:hypothetical protein [Cyclobacteriaceae bacterium]